MEFHLQSNYEELEKNLDNEKYKVNAVDTSLDDFISARPRILKTKMKVFASEIIDRWLIKKQNIDKIDRDRARAESMLELLDEGVRYHLRDHREKSGIYQLLFGLEREIRAEYVSCWLFAR